MKINQKFISNLLQHVLNVEREKERKKQKRLELQEQQKNTILSTCKKSAGSTSKSKQSQRRLISSMNNNLLTFKTPTSRLSDYTIKHENILRCNFLFFYYKQNINIFKNYKLFPLINYNTRISSRLSSNSHYEGVKQIFLKTNFKRPKYQEQQLIIVDPYIDNKENFSNNHRQISCKQKIELQFEQKFPTEISQITYNAYVKDFLCQDIK